MNTKRLIFLAAFLVGVLTASHTQTIADSLTYIVIDDGSTVITINKQDVKEISHRKTANVVDIVTHRNISLDAADYSRFATGTILADWLIKSTWLDYDSIVIIYDAAIVDSLKYYIGSTLEYVESYDNDGSNIDVVK